MSLRVLYSFPHRIGAGRICNTAWHQVDGVHHAGAEVVLMTGSVARPPVEGVRVLRTMERGPMRVPVRFVGRLRASRWHDRRVAAWIASNHRDIDLVHAWPLGSLDTIRTAKRFGIPVFLERPNAHTGFAYEVVAEENRAVGIELPPDHDHAENPVYLEREEKEYRHADFLLCPSDFVAGTFADKGFREGKLLRHRYGYDHERFQPGSQDASDRDGLTLLYAGVCEPRKGLHRALAAWLGSEASRKGRFLICGEFVPGYAETLGGMLEAPGVEFLGHRSDLPEIMAGADAFVLSSVEEGSALVTYEARASGCVLLVSDATGAVCEHEVNGLIHPAGDEEELGRHIARLDTDRELLARLREASLAGVSELTWRKAGELLVAKYREGLDAGTTAVREGSISER